MIKISLSTMVTHTACVNEMNFVCCSMHGCIPFRNVVSSNSEYESVSLLQGCRQHTFGANLYVSSFLVALEAFNYFQFCLASQEESHHIDQGVCCICSSVQQTANYIM